MSRVTNCQGKMARLVYTILFAFLVSGISARPKARPEIDARIAGGNPAKDGQFPYAAALYLNFGVPNQFSFCGGAIISPLYVATAAHCLNEVQEVVVVLGNAFLNESSVYEVRTRVPKNNFIIPVGYVEGVFDWDFALLKLPERIEFNPNLSPVSLPEGSNSFAGDMGVVAGWGATYQAQSTIEQHLRYAENLVISNTECIREYGSSYQDIIHDNHICQSGLGSRGACHGDSGAPLVVDGKLVGVVSFGPYNCFHEFPVVYTRITSLRTWINAQTGL